MLKHFSNKILFIITGTGRCGTVSLAKIFNLIGIPCGHEKIFGVLGLNHAIKVLKQGGENSDVAKWSGLVDKKLILAESSYMAVPFLNSKILSEATIIHVVRNPIDVILSFHNKLQYWHKHDLNKWENFISFHLPEIKKYYTALMKNCYYIIKWNQWIEKQSSNRKYLRIRIEKDLDVLFDYLNIPKSIRRSEKLNIHETWQQKASPLSLPAIKEDILDGELGSEVKTLMEQYGYL